MKINNKLVLFTVVLIVAASALFGQTNKYVSLGNFKEIDFHSFLSVASTGILYDKKWLSPGAEAYVYKFWEDDYSSLGIGVSPVVQLNLLKKDSYKIYMELKGGVIYMFPEYPKTAFNYTLFLGPGFDIMLYKKYTLKLGVGYSHFSNGKTMDYATNSSWDSFGWIIGWVFNSKKEGNKERQQY